MKALRIIPVLLSFFVMIGCSSPSENIPESLVAQLKKSDKLYVTEYVVHKLITTNDLNEFKVSENLSVPLAIGDRKIAIPMNAVLKAYIDFDSVSPEDIVINDNPRSIKLMLNDPIVEMTSSKIDHMAIKEYTGIFRWTFSDKEMTDFENQGRDSILMAIPKMGIMKTAKENARETLIPILMQSGFDADQITIEFKTTNMSEN